MTATETPVRPADAAAGGCLPRKTFDVELKEAGDDGSFTLYAAVFGNVDRGGDVIQPGAFDNLDEFVKDGWIAVNHNGMSLPVGYPTAAVQDGHGLRVTGKFHSTPAAQECRTVARERMSAGKAVKCSLGYLTRKESFDRKDGQTVRRIERLSIYEASFVNLPMNPAAETVEAKGAVMPENPKPPAPEAKAGRAVSQANRDKMQALADRMAAHHGELGEQLKGLKGGYKALCATHKDYQDLVKSFGDEGDDEDGDEGDKPAAKAAPAPPADRHAVAAALAAIRLPD